MTFIHDSVLLVEVTALLAGCRRVLDGTAGAGGHSKALAEAGIEVLAIDRDPQAVAAASETLKGLNAHVIACDFAEAAAHPVVRAFKPDGILLDLGISSPQIDDASRGFTFRPGAPLDMRMEGSGVGDQGSGVTAAEWLNTAPEREIADAFHNYADERKAFALARQVVKRRANKAFEISEDLVGAIRGTLGPRSGPPDFARLFQAVRIVVNGELERLERALPDLFALLQPGGVLAVIAYHSGEDRIVKHLFRDWFRECICPPEQPVCTCRGKALGELLTRHAIEAKEKEMARNPRARSARLRAIRKAGT